jgi:hypothetical protein
MSVSAAPKAIRLTLSTIEPSFYVGPILTTRIGGTDRPLIPLPGLDGVVSEFVYEPLATKAMSDTFRTSPVPPVPPIAELPTGRVTLDQGWLQLTRPAP